jgi:cyclophilin family peptidyl-prolyl cis-trans isomerase
MVKDEINSVKFVRGTVAMANRGPDTNGSQFFILVAPQAPDLQGRYTVFAQVGRGIDVVDAINKTPTKPGDIPVKPIVVERISLY